MRLSEVPTADLQLCFAGFHLGDGSIMGEARPAVLVLLRNGVSLLGDGGGVYGVAAAYSRAVVDCAARLPQDKHIRDVCGCNS